jgi:hypothetical protein
MGRDKTTNDATRPAGCMEGISKHLWQHEGANRIARETRWIPVLEGRVAAASAAKTSIPIRNEQGVRESLCFRVGLGTDAFDLPENLA